MKETLTRVSQEDRSNSVQVKQNAHRKKKK